MPRTSIAADATLTLSRPIAAPRAAVWRCWSDPALFARWWIPEPIRCRVVTMDLHPGGGFETRMSEDGGPFRPHVAGCFLDVSPMERIVFTTVLGAGWVPQDAWLAMTAIFTFGDEGQGTRYTARALHRSSDDSARHAEMGFAAGWGLVIAQLERVAQGLQGLPLRSHSM